MITLISFYNDMVADKILCVSCVGGTQLIFTWTKIRLSGEDQRDGFFPSGPPLSYSLFPTLLCVQRDWHMDCLTHRLALSLWLLLAFGQWEKLRNGKVGGE